MALTDRQIARIQNKLEEFSLDLADGSFAGGVFRFHGVKIVAGPSTSSDEGFSVKFKVIANAEDADDVSAVLNFINTELDGPSDSPIIFDDNSPATPDRITDTFQLNFRPAGPDFDLIDL